ncbi:MAG: hypothetical protein RLZZ455_324 [Candidatus Parcubacteria bacterium]|jgi:hypothetical protein
MKKKIYILLGLIIVAIIAVAVGIYFLGRINNRTSSQSKVRVESLMPGYTLRFNMTPEFADFLYDRGVWRTNGIRIDKKKNPQTAQSVLIVLQNRAMYKGTSGEGLPIMVESVVGPGSDGVAGVYRVNVYLDTSKTARYSSKDLEMNIFLAVLSQIYEDTSGSETTYEGREAKREKITKLAESSTELPLNITISSR